MLHPEVRRAALWVYLGPLVVIAVIVGFALLYWANRGPAPNEDVTNTIATVGDDDTPGGFDPAPPPDSPRDEQEFRGAAPLTSLDALLDADARAVVGRTMTIENVTVADARSASSFWVQDGNRRVAVEAPSDSPAVRNGTRVNVSGVVESDGQGGVRIRATRVETR